MTARAQLLTISASLAVLALIAGSAPVIDGDTPEGQARAQERRSAMDITLVGEESDEGEVAFGEETHFNASVRNDGTDTAVVFLKADIPVAEGAVLTDGTENPEVLDYEVNDGWQLVTTDGGSNVYYYGELEPGEETTPVFSYCLLSDFELSTDENGKVLTGSMTMYELDTLLNDPTMRAYSIQTGISDDPEVLWGLLGN